MTPRVVAGSAAVAVFALATVFGARTASGADALGYVSQAYLWSSDALELEQPLLRDAHWPFAAESLSPLGYRASRRGTAVPTYPPGIPLTMAALRSVVGACGPFLVAPLFGAALVLATSLLAARVTRDPVATSIAAVLMATSPTFLVNVIVPMSDTATAALWTLSLCAVTWGSWRFAAVGGVFAAWAVLARPNLAPLAIAVALAAELWRGPGQRRGVRGAIVLTLSGAAALVIAMLNAHLYGSPFLSGYGSAAQLYAWHNASRNVVQYGLWLAQAEWPILILIGALALRLRPYLKAVAGAAPLALFVALVGGSYLFYSPFDAWWFLRFLLPAFPVVFVAVAAVAARALRRLPPVPRPRGRLLTAAVVLLFVAVRVLPYAGEIFTIGPGEDRYLAVAQFVTRGLPAKAVLIGMQHTGTIRFYAARPTVRMEWITPERLEWVVQELRDRGYRPFLVLENWEEAAFRRRFASTGAIGRLEVRTIAELSGPVGVRIYDPLDPPGGPRPFSLQAARDGCAKPAPQWRTLALW
jgi:hypothetical protein